MNEKYQFIIEVLGGFDVAPNLYKNLKEETTICVNFHQELMSYYLKGKTRGIWLHVPNEGKTSKVYGYILKKMGKIRGMPDYLFLMNDYNLAIEFKKENGKLTKHQKQVKEWFELYNIPYFVHTSVREAIETLKAINFIVD